MTRLFLILWLASLGVDWPLLPGGARLAEVLFVPAAAAVLLSAKKERLRLRGLDMAVMAYVTASAMGLVASSDRAASVAELGRQVYLALTYGVVAMAVTGGWLSVIPAGLTLMGAALAVPALGFALLFLVWPVPLPAVGEVMTVPYAGEVLRLRAFSFSPTMFACVLTVALPFAIAGAVRAAGTPARHLWTAAIVALALALLLTFSHAWAGAALAVTIAAWPVLVPSRPIRLAAIVATLVLTLLFNASLIVSIRSVTTGEPVEARSETLSYAVGEGRTHIGPYTVDYIVMSYFRVKQVAWEAFVSRPFTGIGLDRFHDVTELAYTDGRLTHTYRAIDPHSTLLGRLAETGIFGGLTLVALWVAMLMIGVQLMALQPPASWIARAAVAGAAGLLLASVNVDVMNFRFLWAGFGVLRGLSELKPAASI